MFESVTTSLLYNIHYFNAVSVWLWPERVQSMSAAELANSFFAGLPTTCTKAAECIYLDISPHDRVPMTSLRGYWVFGDRRERNRSCNEGEWRQHVLLLHERLRLLSRQPQEVCSNSCKPCLLSGWRARGQFDQDDVSFPPKSTRGFQSVISVCMLKCCMCMVWCWTEQFPGEMNLTTKIEMAITYVAGLPNVCGQPV